MIRVRQVKVSVKKNTDEDILKAISKKLKIKSSLIEDYKIIKKYICQGFGEVKGSLART